MMILGIGTFWRQPLITRSVIQSQLSLRAHKLWVLSVWRCVIGTCELTLAVNLRTAIAFERRQLLVRFKTGRTGVFALIATAST